MKLVVWSEGATFYNLETFQQLENFLGESIQFVLADVDFEIRIEQGWDPPPFYSDNYLELPKRGFLKEAFRIIDSSPDACHLYISFWGVKRLFIVLLYALFKKRKTVVLFEAYTTKPVGYNRDEPILIAWLKVISRKISYPLAWRIINFLSGNKPPAFLPISMLAYDQLVSDGFEENLFYPYGYFIHRKEVKASRNDFPNGELRLVFSGTLVKRKGLDTVLESIRSLNRDEIKVHLDIYGTGDGKRAIGSDIPGASYKGRYKPEKAQEIMANYDLLIVPSLHEGWGVVINEALLQGVPAIVSDAVGAKCLIEESGAGTVFTTGDSAQVTRIIESILDQPQILSEWQESALKVKDFLTPQAAAKYLFDVLQYHFYGIGARPIPIWEFFNDN